MLETTYVVNGDVQQGTVEWNLICGNIGVVSSSFTTNQDASMVQFIDLVEILNAELPDDIYYCVSFRYSRLYMELIDSTREYPLTPLIESQKGTDFVFSFSSSMHL